MQDKEQTGKPMDDKGSNADHHFHHHPNLKEMEQKMHIDPKSEKHLVDLKEIMEYEEDESMEGHESDEVVFELDNISVGYGKKVIIDGLSAKIHRNDFVVVLGPNGCGKSTLIKTLCRIHNPISGIVKYKGKLISRPLLPTLWFQWIGHRIANAFTKDRKKVIETLKWHMDNYKKVGAYKSKELALDLAYVPQLANFPEATSVYDFVKMGRFPSSNALGINTNHEREKYIIETALKHVGIYDLRDYNLEDLSGGQRQKALIALSLAQDTETIVLDEPTNHLDIRSQLEIIELLHKLHHKMKKTIIIVIHDINNGLKYAHKVMIMKKGQLMRYGKVKEVIDKQILLDVFGVDSIIFKNPQDNVYPPVTVTDFSLPATFKEEHKAEMDKETSEEDEADF
ncbi:ABC transporter ATP-binding protein [Ureaplasma canigenitalium]|uniref:ABC transporter ATP-binding protein n=1 Tax=Ureaplasma canigenitalium TaxID=42092 RepID=UPI000B0DF6E1|nr:ABC transporter ATP-binding protein [Ureaplasma canigenitalium]